MPAAGAPGDQTCLVCVCVCVFCMFSGPDLLPPKEVVVRNYTSDSLFCVAWFLSFAGLRYGWMTLRASLGC